MARPVLLRWSQEIMMKRRVSHSTFTLLTVAAFVSIVVAFGRDERVTAQAPNQP
jgi:hypothetical protein